MEAMLDAAIGVFSEQGYHATSISDLTAATGVTAGSLYKAFADKRAVFLAAFDRYLALRNEQLQDRLAKARSGRERVQAVLALYAEYSHDAQGRRGCLVVGSAVELSVSDAEVASRVAGVLECYETRLAEFVQLGLDDGSIPAHVNGPVAARLLLCVMQGMRVLGKTGRTREDMESLVGTAMKVLS
jgi:TetR/AcrR family transcriptional repressor of nem operon